MASRWLYPTVSRLCRIRDPNRRLRPRLQSLTSAFEVHRARRIPSLATRVSRALHPTSKPSSATRSKSGDLACGSGLHGRRQTLARRCILATSTRTAGGNLIYGLTLGFTSQKCGTFRGRRVPVVPAIAFEEIINN